MKLGHCCRKFVGIGTDFQPGQQPTDRFDPVILS